MEKGFTVNGLNYVASLDRAGDFSFSLVGGNSSKGSARNRKTALWDLYYDDTPEWGDVDLNKNGLTVLKTAGQILVDWVYEFRPWRIGFAAGTDRKVAVYQWLAKKLAKKLPGYRFEEWPEGVFNYYKIPTEE